MLNIINDGVMDSRIGLDYIVENKEYIIKLGTALDTTNVTVKKQVFELLSALCIYNAEGYARALETLDYYKNLKETRYRFKIIVTELDAPSTPTEYQVALLSFVNSIIISTQCLQDRLRIRNEFIGLKILPVLSNIRRVSGDVADIAVQLDVFNEQRECDEAQSLQGPSGINLSSHLDVFYAILGQVADTPQEYPFLSILQHLLRIDPKEPISDIIWDTAETLVHRATLLENREDSTRLLRTPSIQKFTCPHCRGDISSPNRKQSLAPAIQLPTSPSQSFVVDGVTSIPVAPIPPPPPPMMSAINNLTPQFSSVSNATSSSIAPPAPPPPIPSLLTANNASANNMNARSKTPEPIDPGKLLPQQETPVPKTKMKTINWNKIPPNKVVGKHNIWTIVADSHQNSPMAELDWGEMEGLFCQQATSNQGSPKMTRDANSGSNCDVSIGSERRSRRDNSEIILLDGKRSLNVNIFLKQFRTSNDEIIQLIKDGEHDDIGAEKLRGLLKILPEVDELDMLKAFVGDKKRLGNAEKFLMQLSLVPNYKLRVESMLLKEEFQTNLSYLEPSIDAMIFAGDDLMNNKLLREVLYMVVVAGNFLNAGGYAGNAVGVKLSSLQKLTDIRANKPGMNLIHFVALQAEKRNRELLSFPENLTTLENASKTSVEQINNEINALDARINRIKRQIELATTEADLKLQMGEFLQMAEGKVQMLQRAMKEVETVRLQLSEFFCEDPSSFKLEECLKVFQNFCEKFKQAVNDNEKRRLQEEQATIRRKMREEQLAKRARQSQAGTPVSDSDNSMMMDASFDMRSSPAMVRRRIGSFNSNGDAALNRDDGFSPDITPTGSLRRRRSRVLSEEDDNSLMDFLRTSGHDNGTRERKPSSYGSLDRSWSRRARSGSTSRKRPELLNIDFGVDRERPVSPAPPVDVNRSASEETTARPRISREWRQKIESWLQANEQDDRHSDDYKRSRSRRIAGNRRSFENDSENERSKLDTLPEEKPTSANHPTTPTNASEPYKRVYPDYKPSNVYDKAENTANTDPSQRDKSIWRKSNLNLPNSPEEDEYANRTAKNRSREQTPLQSIVEEDRRRNLNATIDKQNDESPKSATRRPSESIDYEPVYQKQDKTSVGITSDQHSIYIRPVTSPTSTVSNNKTAYNTIEIDSDNIETPPTVRRGLSNEKGLNSSMRKSQVMRNINRQISDDTAEEGKSDQKSADKPNDVDPLGDGQFDRHSSARRTRRYRRLTDHSSGNEERNDTTPESPSPTDPVKELRTSCSTTSITLSTRKNDATNDPNILSRVGKIGRNLSSINQEAVQEAIRNLKSPTETPERIWSPPREIVIKDRALVVPQPIKVAQHELNDEGFEETQSLVSDTPSHGKESTSSCNDQPDSNQTIEDRSNIVRMNSSESASNDISVTETSSNRRALPKSAVQKLLERNQQSLERSRSLRARNVNVATQPQQRNQSLPKRANSMRKSEPSSLANKRDVERSSSRNSLRSSRSSLNSSTSTNTVKHLALKTSPNHSSSTVLDSRKKPNSTSGPSATSKSITTKLSNARTPASRSSSSGSSIGPSPRRSAVGLKTSPPSLSSSTSPTHSKEYTTTQRSSYRTPASHSSLSNSSLTSNMSTSRNSASPSGRLTNLTKGITAKSTNRVSNFMRPTAASATKMSNPKGK